MVIDPYTRENSVSLHIVMLQLLPALCLNCSWRYGRTPCCFYTWIYGASVFWNVGNGVSAWSAPFYADRIHGRDKSTDCFSTVRFDIRGSSSSSGRLDVLQNLLLRLRQIGPYISDRLYFPQDEEGSSRCCCSQYYYTKWKAFLMLTPCQLNTRKDGLVRR